MDDKTGVTGVTHSNMKSKFSIFIHALTERNIHQHQHWTRIHLNESSSVPKYREQKKNRLQPLHKSDPSVNSHSKYLQFITQQQRQQKWNRKKIHQTNSSFTISNRNSLSEMLFNHATAVYGALAQSNAYSHPQKKKILPLPQDMSIEHWAWASSTPSTSIKAINTCSTASGGCKCTNIKWDETSATYRTLNAHSIFLFHILRCAGLSRACVYTVYCQRRTRHTSTL